MKQENKSFDREEMLRSLGEIEKKVEGLIEEKEAQDAYIEFRKKPLPEKLYHVTTNDNAQ